MILYDITLKIQNRADHRDSGLQLAMKYTVSIIRSNSEAASTCRESLRYNMRRHSREKRVKKR